MAIDIKNIIVSVVMLIVAIIVVFLIVGNTNADIVEAADNISNSSLPLASLFGSSGVVLLVFMSGLMITLVVLSLSLTKSGGR